MRPALAHGSLSDCWERCALRVPSPDMVCQSKWNSSLVLQMSLPPAWMYQLPLAYDSLPTSAGPPISPQAQSLGQPAGGGAPVFVSVTALRVAEPAVVALCEVTARPARTLEPRGNMAVLLAMYVQV